MTENYLENACREDVVKQLFLSQHPDPDSVTVIPYGSKDIVDFQHYTVIGAFSTPRRRDVYETYRFPDSNGMTVQKLGWWRWKDIPYDELPVCSEKMVSS